MNQDKQRRLDLHYLKIATVVAQRSKDPMTRVGAVVVSADGRAVSFGYNGFPAGVHEDDVLWERPTKYERVQHAELNAVLNCPFDTSGSTVYCTFAPCHRCVGMMINARITRVVWYGPTEDRGPAYRDDIRDEWLQKIEHLSYQDEPEIEDLKRLFA